MNDQFISDLIESKIEHNKRCLKAVKAGFAGKDEIRFFQGKIKACEEIQMLLLINLIQV